MLHPLGMDCGGRPLTDVWPRVCIVGPLPPPSGGMANQCQQLVRLLRGEGVEVTLVQTNAPYVPAVAGRVPILRALIRFIPYVPRLWRDVGRADVVHVFANSGWAWHLLAAPALAIARVRRVPAIVNYRGGLADEFLARARGIVLPLLRNAAMCVTPSAYLRRVFAKYGVAARVVPNIVDLARFSPSQRVGFGEAPHLIVTRNLEPIYDIPTAIRAFARVRQRFPAARLTIAGTGPELDRLRTLVHERGLATCVDFAGRIDNENIASLYARADCMLNPSTADNMPISILEAFASGVPVVSTDAGGIPDLVRHGASGMLVPVGDDAAMATRVLEVLESSIVRDTLRAAGLAAASAYAWSSVRAQWLQAYRDATAGAAA